MVTAKEAREIALLTRQEDALKKREQEREHQAEITATVDDLIEKQIVKMDKDIRKSIRRGEMFETYVADDNQSTNSSTLITTAWIISNRIISVRTLCHHA